MRSGKLLKVWFGIQDGKCVDVKMKGANFLGFFGTF